MQRAVLLAQEAEAPPHALAVEEHVPRFPGTIDEVKVAQEEMDTYFSGVMADAHNVAAEYEVDLKPEVAAGHAAQTICRRAEELEVDLVVIGQSGHSNVWGNFLGTTADKVSRHAPCDVLIVR